MVRQSSTLAGRYASSDDVNGMGDCRGGQVLRGLMLGGVGWLLALPLLVSLEAGTVRHDPVRTVSWFPQTLAYIFIPYSQTERFTSSRPW